MAGFKPKLYRQSTTKINETMSLFHCVSSVHAWLISHHIYTLISHRKIIKKKKDTNQKLYFCFQFQHIFFFPFIQQMASGQSTRELNMKKEIRENVTKALLSLPVSSMMDVDQISSALVQSTVRMYFSVSAPSFIQTS